MKIAIIGTRGFLSRYSGVETSMSELAGRLAERENKLIIYCREANINRGYNNIRLVYLPTINSKHLSTFAHSLLSTMHVIFTNAEIVHFHGLGSAWFSFLPRLFGKKTVVIVHALDWKRKKWNLLARLFLKLSEYPSVFSPNKVVVVAKTLKEYFEYKFKRLVYYIPNGVKIPILDKKREADIPYILFVGRLVPEKGVHYLIDAFKAINKQLKIKIAGESSFTDSYVKYLKDISAGNKNIEFLGFLPVEKLSQLYRNAYLFVLPSEVEGSSVSLLEAMSYGLCVLTSDIKESKEIAQDCGYYFKAADCLDLGGKLEFLADNPDKVKESGKRARELVSRKYNWDSIIFNWEELHKSLPR